MGFLNRLLGHSIEAELRPFCGKNSHPQYPLLRVDYSPMSRYPAGDFTPWIAKKLAEGQYKDIADLLERLTQPNSGLNTDSDWWAKYTLTLCNINLRESIIFDDDKGYLDLHSALFPYALHGSLDGFIIVDDNVDYLARAISPYKFSVRDLETKVDTANQFIKKMRRETRQHSAAWTDCPLFSFRSLESVLGMEAPAHDLRVKLRSMSIGARQLFFGTLENGPGQGGWSARPLGINEDLASTEVANLGLGELCSDPALVLMTYRNEELFQALRGHPTKQGWKKKYIVKYMLENAREVAERLARGKQVLAIRQEVVEDGKVLSEWIGKMKAPLMIALGFMQ
jgi:hypothetical protein